MTITHEVKVTDAAWASFPYWLIIPGAVLVYTLFPLIGDLAAVLLLTTSWHGGFAAYPETMPAPRGRFLYFCLAFSFFINDLLKNYCDDNVDLIDIKKSISVLKK